MKTIVVDDAEFALLVEVVEAASRDARETVARIQAHAADETRSAFSRSLSLGLLPNAKAKRDALEALALDLER